MNIHNELTARSRITEYIDYLINNPRIEIRQSLIRYKAKLALNGTLTSDECNTLWAFIKRDTNKTKKVIELEYQHIIERESVDSTLDRFL